LVLTFDFAYSKLQREHPHKLSDYIVKERLEIEHRPRFKQTHHYTGQHGLMNSPACLYLFSGSGPDTPCLERAGHYSGELPPVNYFWTYFTADWNPSRRHRRLLAPECRKQACLPV